MRDDLPINRRGFFRQGLRQLLKGAIDAARPLGEAARRFAELEKLAAEPLETPAPPAAEHPVYPTPSPWLRAPGARPEYEFLEVCARCAECVKVCPVQCLVIDPSSARGDGAPYIDADDKACILCDNLACTTVCPSGALLPVARADVRMGLARWLEGMCLRTQGQDCMICVEKCPVGAAALRVTQSGIEVLAEGCTGCGQCQQHCPTMPRSINVTPREW